jgi:GNAT superfamily N-acetyltransferase
MVPRVANAHSLSLRPLIQDDIEALRMVEKMARTRYRALGGFFAQAAEAPAIAAERFVGGETIVAELHFAPVGFLLLRPLDELLHVVTIAVSPDAADLGIGRLLMTKAEHRARQLKVAGLSLTTFRTPPWNGPWFHRQGYWLIPSERIGPGPRNFGPPCDRSRYGDARDPLEANRHDGEGGRRRQELNGRGVQNSRSAQCGPASIGSIGYAVQKSGA